MFDVVSLCLPLVVALALIYLCHSYFNLWTALVFPLYFIRYLFNLSTHLVMMQIVKVHIIIRVEFQIIILHRNARIIVMHFANLTVINKVKWIFVYRITKLEASSISMPSCMDPFDVNCQSNSKTQLWLIVCCYSPNSVCRHMRVSVCVCVRPN